MPIIEIVFYLFGAVLIASALSVVTVGNPVYAVLFLVLSFFSAACIWLLLQAEFFAIVLVYITEPESLSPKSISLPWRHALRYNAHRSPV